MNKVYVFNSPVETGLRVLVILNATYPNRMDLQQVLYYDYLTVHSGDVDGGPKSLHPQVPNRSGEIFVRRKILEDGIELFISSGLIEKVYTLKGIEYQAGENATPFLDMLNENYTLELAKRAQWVVKEFGHQTIEQLDRFIKNNLDKWGGEFTFCSVGGEVDGRK